MSSAATPATCGQRELAVFDTTDGITVAHARCTHGAANLCDGYFDGTHIECPLHQGLYHIASGAARSGPACEDLPVYPVAVHDGTIYVQYAEER